MGPTSAARRSEPIRLALALFVLATAGCCAPPSPAWRRTLRYADAETFSIRLGPHGFPMVRSAIDRHPVELVLDTANMSDLVLSRGLAERLGLPVVGRSDYFGSDGRRIGSRREYRVRSLGAFGAEWPRVVAFEDDRSDEPGLIGPHYLLGRRFTLDYRARRLAVSASPLPAGSFAGTRLPLVWSERYPGMLVVRGAVNGQPVLMQLDTGKSRTCVDPVLARSLGLEAVPGGVRVRELTLGGVSLFVSSAKEVSFSALGQGLPEPVVVGVGSDVLSRLLLTVDYGQRAAFIGWQP